MLKSKKNHTKATPISILLPSLILMLLLLLTSIVQAQWYIDNEEYGMGWWGQDAENLQEGGGQRLPG